MKKLFIVALLLTGIMSSNAQASPRNSHKDFDRQYAQTDSLKTKVEEHIGALLFDGSNPRPGVDVVKVEREAIKKFSKLGEQVACDLISLYKYLTYATSLNKTDLDAWFMYKSKLITKYSDAVKVETLNNDAWFALEKAEAKKQLEAALSWSKIAITRKPIGNYYDTYGNLLYKLGRTAEAIAAMEHALTLPVGNDGGSTEEITKNLEKMRAGQKIW